MESNEEKIILKWWQTHGYKEKTDSCETGGDWELGEEGEGIKQRKKRKTHGHRHYGDC